MSCCSGLEFTALASAPVLIDLL
jgi:hypothetical protein